MADAVASQTLVDGEKTAVLKLTNISVYCETRFIQQFDNYNLIFNGQQFFHEDNMLFVLFMLEQSLLICPKDRCP